MKKLVFVTTIALFSVSVAAGTPVYGVDKDLGVALEKSVSAVENAAKIHKTCVSEYPSLESCSEAKGYWQRKAVRANHSGSCADKPSDLDDLIKAKKGLL